VVPNARFRVMERYFAPDSIHRWGNYTCALQVNLDVPPGVDWQEATVLGFVLSRFTHALFANSAYLHGGRVAGSARQQLSGLVDPRRRRVPPEVVLAPDLAAAYRDWALEVDVLFVGDVGLEHLPRRGELSFRRWIEEGYRGTYPDTRAWTRHLGTLWPDVRPRKFVELRAADAQPFEHVMAVVAFWRAFIQLPGGTEAVRELVGDFGRVLAQDEPDPRVHDALLALAARRIASSPEAHWAGALEAYRGFVQERAAGWQEAADVFVAKAATPRPGVAFSRAR
jgi:glutamate--cysteine ligase